MRSINHVPKRLRHARDSAAEWSFRRALISGSAWTGFVGVVFAVLVGSVAYRQPVLFVNWALCAVVMFLVTAILHTVMNSVSTMVTHVGNGVAIGMAVIVVISAYFARLSGLAADTFPPTNVWALFSLAELVIGNGAAWLGILIAAYICKDGHDILEHIGVYTLAHILMVRRR